MLVNVFLPFLQYFSQLGVYNELGSIFCNRMTLRGGFVIRNWSAVYPVFKGRHIWEIEQMTGMLHAVMEENGELFLKIR